MLTYRNRLKRKYSIKAKCSRHPRYNPERSGRGGIVGGCRGCEEVFDFWFLTKRLDAVLYEMDTAAGRWSPQRLVAKAVGSGAKS